MARTPSRPAATTWMLVVDTHRTKILAMDLATRAFRAHATLSEPSDREILDVLEQGRTSGAFSRLVVVAPAARLEALSASMSSGLRATLSMQCARGEFELPADEVEARFRRLRSSLSLPFVA